MEGTAALKSNSAIRPEDIRVLVIDDDQMLVNMLTMLFKKDGYQVLSALSGPKGLNLAKRHDPDVVILDIMMPGMHGYEVCQRLRDHSDAVVIFISAKGATEDIVRGLQTGGDDYVVKPYTYQELSSRVLACLRRRDANKHPTVMKASDDIMLVDDPARRIVFAKGHEIQLTPTEYEVLKYLLRHQGKVLSQDAILANAWGPEYIGSHHLAKQFIYRLRSKLEPDPHNPQYIHTVRGSGYVFEADGGFEAN